MTSSQKKTPIINAVTWPIEEYQQKLWNRYKDECRYAEDPETIRKLDEKLADISRAQQPRSFGEARRAGRWIGQMEKYGGIKRGANAKHAFWLQAYDGGSHIVDRIQRGQTIVKKLSTSLLGGIQPQKLERTARPNVGRTVARFPSGHDGSVEVCFRHWLRRRRLQNLVRKLLEMPPKYLRFPRALEAMTDLRRHLHDLEQVSGGLTEGFQVFRRQTGRCSRKVHAHPARGRRSGQVSRRNRRKDRRRRERLDDRLSSCHTRWSFIAPPRAVAATVTG